MSSSSGSVCSFQNDEETTVWNEKLDRSETALVSTVEAFSAPNFKPNTISAYTISQNFAVTGRLILDLFPFTQLFSRTDVVSKDKISSTAHLDGIRGLAAFAVFLCHLSYGTWDIVHVYGAGEQEGLGENNSLLQLPIVRLVYSGPPMVAIFFVISGYALSYKPLKLMRAKKHEDLFNTVTSSLFRRALRLFLPCFVSTFVVVLLAQLGIYKMTEDFAYHMRGVIEDHAQTLDNPVLQIWDWAQKMLEFVNVFDWTLYSGSIDLDRHLWTIPAEFRCSLALFLSHILVARMSPRLRMLTLAFLTAWGLYWNRWEMMPFWSGCIIAEMDLIKASAEDLSSTEGEDLEGLGQQDRKPQRSTWTGFWYVMVFATGLFLASYPDRDGHLSPGYKTLTRMIPAHFAEKHRFWPTIGAALIIWSASNLSCIKAFFNTSLLQYLGKISFPLYVCHGFVIHTLGYMLMDRIYKITGYDDRFRFQMGFLVAALITIVVTIWTSELFLRIVDTRCVRFAKWLEAKFFES